MKEASQRRHSDNQPRLEDYRYETLNSPSSIRLLEISKDPTCFYRFRLVQVRLEERLDYVALSYFWGKPILSHEIVCDGAIIKVTESLHRAILCLSSGTEIQVYYWIDQICIDQQNHAEKGVQVRLMGQIYAQATQCLVYLGEAARDDCEAFNVAESLDAADVESIRSESDLESNRLPRSSSAKWSAYFRLLCRPWFRRVWVVQEVVLPTKVSMFMASETNPRRCISIDLLCRSIVKSELLFSRMVVHIDDPAADFAWNHVDTARDQLGFIKKQKDKENTNFSLINIVQHCQFLESTDPRDHIYSFLGLALDTEALNLPVDYQLPCATLFSLLACGCVQRDAYNGNLVLACSGIYYGTHGRQSWVPDWTRRKPVNNATRSCLDPQAQLYQSGGSFDGYHAVVSPDQKILSVNCSKIDNVSWLNSFAPVYFPKILRGYKTVLAFKDVDEENMAELRKTSYYFDDQPKLEAYRETLVAGWFEHQMTKSGFNSMFDNSLIQLMALECRSQADVGEVWDRASPTDRRFATGFKRRMSDVLIGRSFCITERGLIGLLPNDSKPGDILAVIHGLPTPYIIRQKGENFVLVGECYIHGIMYGEALKFPGTVTETVRIE